MLTPGRHPEDPKMEQKVDYYTPTQSKQVVNILKTLMSRLVPAGYPNYSVPKQV